MKAAPSSPFRVHQVLATLGYGDAIGHEVLGIQRVLRRAGFESEIFVETADPRLESFVPARILVASACTTAAIWLAGQRSRWSAIAPVSVNRLSTT